jgi:plasmid stabilization system protein ParE
LGFRIDITQPALDDAEEYVLFIRVRKKEPEAAARWFRGLVHAIYSLEELPERCPIIPEQRHFPIEIRHLQYFSHRIIYSIDTAARRVLIYRIYHGARRGLTTPDLRSELA